MTVPAGRIEQGLLLIEDTPASPRREVPAPHSKDTYRTRPRSPRLSQTEGATCFASTR
jgi:hypothetical protein